MKRLGHIAFGVIWIALTLLVFAFLRDANWLNSWWKSALTLLPDIAIPVIAFFELQHSAEANALRLAANRMRLEANELRESNNDLQRQIATLHQERNVHLEQIAQNTRRPRSLAERSAELLRNHLGEFVVVEENQGRWPPFVQLVDVSVDNIATLFIASSTGTEAWAQNVQCDYLDVLEVKEGACNLRLIVRQRFGTFIRLGEIKSYRDRMQIAEPSFEKSDLAYEATYELKGTDQRRWLRIYKSGDGSNLFMFEASTDERLVADNLAVAKRLLATRVDYLDQGFSFRSENGPNAQCRLFIGNR